MFPDAPTERGRKHVFEMIDAVKNGYAGYVFMLIQMDTINHFNFYFTGFLTPLFFFSGIVFPLDRLPYLVQLFAEILPLIHSVEIIRGLYFNNFQLRYIFDLLYNIFFILLFSYWALKRLEKKMIQ